MTSKMKEIETLPAGSIVSLRYPSGYKYKDKEVFTTVEIDSVKGPTLSIGATTLRSDIKSRFDALHYPGGYSLKLFCTMGGEYRLAVKAEKIIASTIFKMNQEEVHRLLENYRQAIT